MFCKVFTTGNDNYVYLNPNCNMKLIYEYLRVISDIPEHFEIDLCSDDGKLLGIYDAECSASGLSYLRPRANYFMFAFDYHEDKPDLSNPRPLMEYTDTDFFNVFGRIKKNFGIPRDEYINEDDAALIFEHMLKAYEERTIEDVANNMTDLASKSSRGSIGVIVNTKKSSRKSVKSDGASRVLQVWREEKRAKLAELSAEAPEPLQEVSKRNRSSIFFPVMDFKNVVGIEEEVEDEDERKNFTYKKRISTAKKAKKVVKKKKIGKESGLVIDDAPRKAAPPIGVNLERGEALMVSNADSNHHLQPIVQYHQSPSSISDLPKPPSRDITGDNNYKSQIVRRIKKKGRFVPKKRSKLSK